MPENTGGAGPALAAHSKDASTPGQTPASEATGEAIQPRSGGDGETVIRLVNQVTNLVRQQPVASIAVFVALGVIISKMRGRR